MDANHFRTTIKIEPIALDRIKLSIVKYNSKKFNVESSYIFMIKISNNKAKAIIIIVFDVDPYNQQSLIDAAILNTEKVMSKKSGFISANFHKSVDGKKIVNYAQWENQEIYKQAITNLTEEETKLGRTISEFAVTNIDFNIYEGNSIFTLGKEGNNTITISKQQDIATIVNVFSVEPQNQQKLIDIWKAFATEIAQNQPGFISANLHKSFDKIRVANYAQWRSKDDVEAMLKVPDAKDYTEQMSEISSQYWGVYNVVYTSN
jgi:quinol monooxygenase YgiN